jgi:hypothetical protein
MPTPQPVRREPEPKQSFTRSASDPRSVRTFERLEKRRIERFHQALAAVMNTEAGRIVMATYLDHAGIERSPWTASAEIHYNVGWQDFGRAMKKDIEGVSRKLAQQMQREQWEWTEQQERTIEAAHTRTAAEMREQDDGRSNT